MLLERVLGAKASAYVHACVCMPFVTFPGPRGILRGHVSHRRKLPWYLAVRRHAGSAYLRGRGGCTPGAGGPPSRHETLGHAPKGRLRSRRPVPSVQVAWALLSSSTARMYNRSAACRYISFMHECPVQPLRACPTMIPMYGSARSAKGPPTRAPRPARSGVCLAPATASGEVLAPRHPARHLPDSQRLRMAAGQRRGV